MMFPISRMDRTVPGKIKQTFTYVHARMRDNIKGARSFCMKPQSDRLRGKTGTSHGSHDFLEFSRSKVQFVGGRFAKEMRVLLGSFGRQLAG